MKTKPIVLIAIFLACIMQGFVLAQEPPLYIETENILLEMSDGSRVGIRNMFRLMNQSDDPIDSNKENPLIRVPIHEHAENVQVMLAEEQLAYERVDNELIIYHQLEGHSTTGISITYFLETDHLLQGMTIVRHYPVGQLTIMVPDDIGLHIHSDQLSDMGALSMGQRIFYSYAITDLAGNTPIEITVHEGKNEQGRSSSNSRIKENYDGFHNPGHIRFWEKSPFSGFDPHLMTLIFVVLIGFSIGYYFYRWHIDEKKIKEMQENHDEDVFLRLYKEEKVLKRKIIELEMLKDDGKIDEEEFEKRREIYKKKLINVKLKIREFIE